MPRKGLPYRVSSLWGWSCLGLPEDFLSPLHMAAGMAAAVVERMVSKASNSA